MQTNINNEASARTGADGGLDTRLTAVEKGSVSPQTDLNMNKHNILNVGPGGMNVADHKHNGADGSATLSGSAVQVKSGEVGHDAQIPLPSGFAISNCNIMAAFRATTGGGVDGIDEMCVRTYTGKDTSNNDVFKVDCLYSGGGAGSKADCSDILQNPAGYDKCTASYIMVCVK